MQQNLYTIAILEDTPTGTTGEVNTSIVVTPTPILATNAQTARDKAIRLVPDNQAENIDRLRVFVWEVANSYNSY